MKYFGLLAVVCGIVAIGIESIIVSQHRLAFDEPVELIAVRGGTSCYKYGIITCTPADKKTCEQKYNCEYWEYNQAGTAPETPITVGQERPGRIYKWLCPQNEDGIQSKVATFTNCIPDLSVPPNSGFSDIKNKQTNDEVPVNLYQVCYKIQFCQFECGAVLTDGSRGCVSGSGADCPDPNGRDPDCRKVLTECKTGPFPQDCSMPMGSK